MITRILVPTDFSETATNAVSYALSFAKKTGVQVYLVHVIDIPVSDSYFVADSYAKYMHKLEQTALASFEKLEKKLYRKSGVEFRSAVLKGDVFDEVHSYAQKEKIDLIIMGTSGAGGQGEVFFGSNAANVISSSAIPVLVVPPWITYCNLKHIVYATDYYEPEFPAVSRLIYLADLFQARVTVLHVKSKYDQYLDMTKNFFVRNKDNISFKNWQMIKITHEDTMKGIGHFIDMNGVDLLVLAKHKGSFFKRIFHRSLCRHMAYHTNVPLLILDKESH